MPKPKKSKNIIEDDMLGKYVYITESALEKAKEAINPKNKQEADEIIKMVEAYLSDTKFFAGNDDFVKAFGAINYAHGWLDCGARLGVFDVKDSALFTIK